ncbi:MAG: hypothetical protein ABJA82_18885 [Myxococcales bacterium]
MSKAQILTSICMAAGVSCLWCNPAGAREESGIVLLNDHETSRDTTGAVRDAEVDSAGLAIVRPAALGTIAENAAPQIKRRPLRRAGKLDKPIFELELRKNFNDVEECRFRVAAAAGIPVATVKAGKISLHWTLLPSGRMRDTVVLETAATDFPLMKCIRRHMNGWKFTPPRGGSVSLDYDYLFPPVEAAPL